MNVVLFVLGTLAVTFTATIDTKPAMAGVRPAATESLALTVVVVADGFAVKARGGNVAPGCAGVGPGIAVPKRDAATYDFAALATCAARLKQTAPDERSVTIGANPEIPYQVVVSAFDALRTDELFPEVSLAVAR